MAYQVSLFQSGQGFSVEADETLLDAALRTGVALPHDCRLGGCGTCRVRLLEGAVAYQDEPFGLTPQEAADGYALACQARPTSDLVIMAGAAGDALPAPAHHSVVVREIRALSEGIHHLLLEADGETADQALHYLAGQYMNVHLPDGSVRSFSMASKPNGRMLDFHVRRVPGGKFTDQMLTNLSRGDRLQIEAPLGSFHYRAADYRPLLMVATGTGLAPIKAILQTLMDDQDCPPVTLYWGMRCERDLYLAEEIRQWEERLYDFRFIPVLSRPGPAWTGRRGYVQQAIAEDFDDLSEHALYLCGSPQMIRDAKPVLLERGAGSEHIYVDSFNFAHQMAEKAQAA